MTFTTDPNRVYPVFNRQVPEIYYLSAGGRDVEYYHKLILPPFILLDWECDLAEEVATYVTDNRITPPMLSMERKGSIETGWFFNGNYGIDELAFALRRLNTMPETDEMLVHYATDVIGEVLGTSPIQFYNGRDQEVLIELPGPKQIRRELYYADIAERLRLVYMRHRKVHPHMMVRFEHNGAIILLDKCYHSKKEVMLDRIQRAYLRAIYRFRSRVDWHDKAKEKEAV